MPSDNKTTYAGYLTVPGASTDPIQSEGDTTIGGDIVKNFKAIGDTIQKKNSNGGVTVGNRDDYNSTDSYSTSPSVVSSYNSVSNANYSVVLGSRYASSNIANSINTMSNSDSSYVDGLAGWKGCSFGSAYGSYFSGFQNLGITIPSTGYGVLDIEAIFTESGGTRKAVHYRVVIDPTHASTDITVLQGNDVSSSTRFEYTGTNVYLNNPDSCQNAVLNIRYTILKSMSSPSSYYGGLYGYY